MTKDILRAGRVAWALIGIGLVLASVIGIAAFFWVIFPPLILAGAIVFVLNPLVTRLQHKGIPRAGGAAITYLGLFGVVTVVALLLIPLAINQANELAEEWPQIRDSAYDFVDDIAEKSEGTIFEFSRADIEDSFDDDGASFSDRLKRIREIGLKVFHVVLIAVIGPIIAFYFLVDLPHIRRVTESLIPEQAKPEVMLIGHRLNRAIGGFFRGQLFVAFIVGILCSIGLLALDVRFWFLVGMIAGLFNIIPLIGPWVGGLPAVVIALTTGGGPLKAVGVAGIMLLIQQFDNHFITPYVMQRAVRLHPAMVMLALLAGGTLFGFVGLLLAVPAAAVLKILIGHVWRVHVLMQPLEEAFADEFHADTRRGVGMVADVPSKPATT